MTIGESEYTGFDTMKVAVAFLALRSVCAGEQRFVHLVMLPAFIIGWQLSCKCSNFCSNMIFFFHIILEDGWIVDRLGCQQNQSKNDPNNVTHIFCFHVRLHHAPINRFVRTKECN